MPVQAFSFPIPETRFFQVGQHVYKFKIKPGSKISSEEEMLDSEFVSEELENAVRVVLLSLDNLHPFATQHFNVFPYRSKWECVSELRFRKGDTKLFAYPFLITLYVETNDPVPPLRANHASTQVPSIKLKISQTVQDRESRLDSPQLYTSCGVPVGNEPKRRRTEEPQEGPLISEELPEVAEEIVCGNEIHTDSEEISPAPSAPSPEFDVVEQDALDSKCTERENPGALARLVSIAAFPFSLLFRRS
ncbi:membrane-anchored junction protein [Clarias gariepinus]|uniref:membrane-anchored junction protein n=1 Tax=Clarias gariepinus TaxID=13013 RepID=UPI00234D0AD8|nr:membrane-anchored junction protein [Clarias gariepinus]